MTVEFRMITRDPYTLNRQDYVVLHKIADVKQVFPMAVGDLIVLSGKRYHLVEVEWTVDDDMLTGVRYYMDEITD